MKHAVCHLYNRTYSDMQHKFRELNATVEMLIQINTLNQNCLSSKCDKNLSEVYIISYCFYFVPESHVSISIGDTLEDKTER